MPYKLPTEYRFIVTVSVQAGALSEWDNSPIDGDTIQSEIDSNLESCIGALGIEDFSIERLPDGSCLRGKVHSYRDRVEGSLEQ